MTLSTHHPANPYSWVPREASVAIVADRPSLWGIVPGWFLGIATIGAALARSWMVIYHYDQWKPLHGKVADVMPMVAVVIFAVTALGLLSNYQIRNVSLKKIRDWPLYQGFITLAILAMLLRVVSEPHDVRAFHWHAYSLTGGAVSALGMVYLRIRSAREDK